MELKKKSWRDVSINEYFDLKEKLDDTTLNEYEKEVTKLAFITEQDEDNIWSLSINEFRALQVQSLWMQEFPISDNPKFSTIKINKETYNIDTNLQNFTIAQYIDFQSFYSKRKSNERVLGNILACFIIPKGHKYAEGYDIQELVSTLNNNLDILTANEIMFFFLKQYLISIRVLANYFNWMMKRLKKKSKNQEQVKDLEEHWERMKKATLDGLHSLTTLESLPETNGMMFSRKTSMSSSI